ncbi:MAG: hypoxanthine phosphoribosyltransferase [Oscillospiraceae bacterium]|nr:hypoxanthine phosphoribosyltransferase [Oscillospiraceae bacterium]
MEIDRILLTQEQLQTRIRELGAILSAEYAEKTPVFIGVLRGAVHFFTDLTLQFSHPCQYDFIGAASYGDGTQTSGRVQLTKDVMTELKGRHVVVVEDILDTGLTLRFVTDWLKSKQPASLKLCVLLDKPERRRADITADYIGFTIPNEFVVGYGLDYQELYRNLPYIGVLKP